MARRSKHTPALRLEFTEEEWLTIELLADREKTGFKEALLRAAEAYLERPFVSAHDLGAHLAGVIDGPEDLATNPKYMEDFGA